MVGICDLDVSIFVDAHFLNDHANVQACIMIILVRHSASFI